VAVSGQSDSLTLPGATAAEENLETLPGNVSVFQAEQYRGGALTSMDDALSLTLGVFAQPKEGSEEVRLSVRGSGINVPFGSRGVQILRDGIPLTRADGFINPEPADASNADYIEVYRGADGFEFGAASLGGAINVVSPTGRSLSGLDARAEFGSFGYRRGQLRYGIADDGRMDGFLAVSGVYTDGFRQNSKETNYRFAGNLGYRFTPKSEGRFFFDYERVDMRRPGPITLAQLQTDPFVAGVGVVRSNARIDVNPSFQLAYQHTLLLGNADRLSISAQYLRADFDNPYPFAHSRGGDRDYGFALHHEVNRDLGTHRNRFVWGEAGCAAMETERLAARYISAIIWPSPTRAYSKTFTIVAVCRSSSYKTRTASLLQSTSSQAVKLPMPSGTWSRRQPLRHISRSSFRTERLGTTPASILSSVCSGLPGRRRRFSRM